MRLLAFAWMTVLAGCDCGGGEGGGAGACESSTDCAAGMICRDRMCVRDGDVDAGDGGNEDDAGGGEPDACATCGDPCAGDGDCGDDSWCSTDVGRCRPYDDVRDRNPMCELDLRHPFRTRVQCEWTAPPEGDPFPSHVMASSLPLVVDFGVTGGPDDPPHPWIVVVMGPIDGGSAIIRVLDGTTCAQVANLPDHTVIQGDAPAAGDLDGDGRAEIVSVVEGGTVVAWTYDPAMSAFRVLWRSTDASAGSLSTAVSLVDLDDAGGPEVVVGSLVYSGADGALLTAGAGVVAPLTFSATRCCCLHVRPSSTRMMPCAGPAWSAPRPHEPSSPS